MALATAALTPKLVKVAPETESTTGLLASMIRSSITGKARLMMAEVSWFSPSSRSVILPASKVTVTVRSRS